ncbi:MAG TPA: iron-containing alcohol dehydrogenase, partial [Negativicutes bacterium]
VELIAGYLRAAVRNGKDIEAREMMIYAAYLAGIAFNNASLGYVHAAAHQLGGYYNLPHGMCNAIMLPVVAQFNATAVPEKFLAIGLAFGIDTFNLSSSQVAQKTVEAIRSLARDIGIPSGLRAIKGFREEDIPALAANALLDVCSLTNPRKANQLEMENLFQAAL